MADDLVDKMLLTVADEAELRGKAEGIALGEARGKTEGMALGKAEGVVQGKTEGLAQGIAQVLDLLKSGKPPEEILQFYGEAAF